MKPLALVIENDGSTRRLLDVLLSRSGFEVDLVPAGDGALLLLEHARYDLVLLDLPLPGTSGMPLLEWIARERPWILAKVIILSSASERHLQAVREQWPRVRILHKPFELGEIVDLVQAMTADRAEHVPSPVEELSRLSVQAGARGGVVARRTGSTLEVHYSFGYKAEDLAAYFPLAVEAHFPICAAIRNGTPVWLASVSMAETEYPLLQSLFAKKEIRALACLPLLRDGHAAGAVAWSFREPRLFTEPERQAFLTIAAILAGRLPDEDGQSITAAGA